MLPICIPFHLLNGDEGFIAKYEISGKRRIPGNSPVLEEFLFVIPYFLL